MYHTCALRGGSVCVELARRRLKETTDASEARRCFRIRAAWNAGFYALRHMFENIERVRRRQVTAEKYTAERLK